MAAKGVLVITEINCLGVELVIGTESGLELFSNT
jgi:hypothetical protein